MLKQKIDTAALFAQKKTEVQSSARTLLILDGQENAYISADELTEEVIQKRSKKRKGKRAEDLSGLPKEIINHDLSEDELRALYPDEEWKKLPDEIYQL